MVKIVLAGGAGNVGREVLEALLAENKHETKVFSRKEVPDLAGQGVTVDVVDYSNKAALATALKGVDIVLSLIITFNDPKNQSQRNLIDACIEGGVRRFAPITHIPRQKYMQIFPMPIHVEDCRAIVRKDTKARITLNSVQDLTRIVTKAVDYEGAWPEVGGVCANQVLVLVLDFIGLCEKIRGQKFLVESVEKGDLEEGKFTSSWFPVIVHPSVSEDQTDAFSQIYFSAFILALERGGWDASNEWNNLLSDFQFTSAEEFLSNIWKHRS